MVADRALLARNIGSWLGEREDGHLFAFPGSLALAESLPVERINIEGLEEGANQSPTIGTGVHLHLLRDELGNAVSYARSGGDAGQDLLSVTNKSPLPGLIDRCLDELDRDNEEEAEVSIVLQPSISLAALHLRIRDEHRFGMLRIIERDPRLEIVGTEEFRDAVRSAFAAKRAHALTEQPG